MADATLFDDPPIEDVACIDCDTEDGAGLTPLQVLDKGWTGLQADPRANDPNEPGIWWGFLGTCPKCKADGK